MAGLVAVKRLSAVEVDRDASNQREFHADRFRRELGFPAEDFSGPLVAAMYSDRGLIAEETTYTLYEARKPPRSEFRLYPATNLFQEHAEPGDLLVVFREPGADALRIIVARRGSAPERELLDAIFVGDIPTLDTFQYIEPRETSETEARNIAQTLAPHDPLAFAVTDHGLYGESMEKGEYPPTRAMAAAARDIVAEYGGLTSDPDRLLFSLLEAETELFFAIEDGLAGPALEDLHARAAGLTEVLEFAMKRFQSRKSRRGASLQNHFEVVLREHGVPYTPQCITEAPPPADIMVPSCDNYGDPNYPAEKLRMVSCKTTTRERWYETIPESARIATKYLLTLDEEMSDSKVRDMHARRVLPFLPEPIIAKAYGTRAIRPSLGNVAALIAELKAAVSS